MTSMPLTLSRIFAVIIRVAQLPLPRAGEGRGEGFFRSRCQDWQSSGVRRVSFFSTAYLSAAAFTIGLMICSSACSQSEVKLHLVPSQVCTRAHVEPM